METKTDIIIKNKAHSIWAGIIYRTNLVNLNQRNYAYKDSSICDEWKDFNVFYEWFRINYIEGYQIDKDILVKNNKIYSPETCCFVPMFINSLFTKSDKSRGKYPIGVGFANKKYKFRIRRVINGIRTRYGKAGFNTVEEAFNEYKRLREEYIVRVANDYKDKITDNVYNAMLNYKVEYND